METQAVIQDDFLPIHDYNVIYDAMTRPDFDWYYNSSTLYGIDYNNDLSDRGQFVHGFYTNNNRQVSPRFQLVKPILDKLGATTVFRVKANLQLRTEYIEQSGWHTDGYDNCITSIYYINDNDGVTELEDGSYIDSVANRMVSFPSSMKHQGSTCTNSKTRIVINFNYHGTEQTSH